MKPIVFAVEDDSAIQEAYTYSLENEFDFRCFDDSISFFDAISKCCSAIDSPLPDIVLLDIMLQGDDGYTILSRLKSNEYTSHIPVIMISAKGEEISKVKGLNMGADDYLAKPLGVMELVARIKAHLRKVSKKEADTITYKDITIDVAKHQITANGVLFQTTLKEYNLFCMLCNNSEKVLERETIFAEVWTGNFVVESRTIDFHIKELRKKLADANSVAEIKTIRGVGYMLT